MTSEDRQGLYRILRVWYSSDSISRKIDEIYIWWQSWSKKPFINNFGDWEQDDAISSFWKKIQEMEYIFLSHKPLTFGHSQVIIPSKESNKSKSEGRLFFEASYLIAQAINVFNTVFDTEKVHEIIEYKSLSITTNTYGNYIKTLVLRSSASEGKGEYKVHLTPYFQSQEIECKKFFQASHPCAPHKTGGLLGWLGKRETEVDEWEFKDCWNGLTLNDVALDLLKLPQLAYRLRQLWQLGFPDKTP